jgi:hypothetical protein
LSCFCYQLLFFIASPVVSLTCTFGFHGNIFKPQSHSYMNSMSLPSKASQVITQDDLLFCHNLQYVVLSALVRFRFENFCNVISALVRVRSKIKNKECTGACLHAPEYISQSDAWRHASRPHYNQLHHGILKINVALIHGQAFIRIST